MSWSDPKSQAFRLMSSLGITRVEVHFSGGHDEGGVNEIRAWKGDEQIEIPVVYDGDNIEWDEESKTWKEKKEEEKGDLEKLSVLLQGPVYAEYDSFAGEFYVHGIVYWKAEERTVKMEKDEEVSVSEHRSYDL